MDIVTDENHLKYVCTHLTSSHIWSGLLEDRLGKKRVPIMQKDLSRVDPSWVGKSEPQKPKLFKGESGYFLLNSIDFKAVSTQNQDSHPGIIVAHDILRVSTGASASQRGLTVLLDLYYTASLFHEACPQLHTTMNYIFHNGFLWGVVGYSAKPLNQSTQSSENEKGAKHTRENMYQWAYTNIKAVHDDMYNSHLRNETHLDIRQRQRNKAAEKLRRWNDNKVKRPFFDKENVVMMIDYESYRVGAILPLDEKGLPYFMVISQRNSQSQVFTKETLKMMVIVNHIAELIRQTITVCAFVNIEFQLTKAETLPLFFTLQPIFKDRADVEPFDRQLQYLALKAVMTRLNAFTKYQQNLHRPFLSIQDYKKTLSLDNLPLPPHERSLVDHIKVGKQRENLTHIVLENYALAKKDFISREKLIFSNNATDPMDDQKI